MDIQETNEVVKTSIDAVVAPEPVEVGIFADLVCLDVKLWNFFQIPQQSIVNNLPVPISAPKVNALSLLAQYSGTESEDDDEEEPATSVYRKPKSESSSSCSSDADEENDIKVIEKKIREPVEDDDGSDDEGDHKKKKREPLKVKGELSIDDLPPIQDLQITIDERECMEIGIITTIVDQLGKLTQHLQYIRTGKLIHVRLF